MIRNKRFGATDVVGAIERRGLVLIILARLGKLWSRSSARLRSWTNYETFRDLVGNVRSLVEAAFPLKSMIGGVIYSRS